jgi:hypothetical protein
MYFPISVGEYICYVWIRRFKNIEGAVFNFVIIIIISIYVRKLPDIPRELPRYVDRATYPEGMLGVLSRKHYAGFPLLLSELDV